MKKMVPFHFFPLSLSPFPFLSLSLFLFTFPPLLSILPPPFPPFILGEDLGRKSYGLHFVN
jgi:hypothetical protein